jgi:CRISPR type I-E-associated protein CasA/Cse1
LKDVFSRSEEITTLVGDPIEKFSILRLLLCIAQAAIDGPKNENDWVSCRDKIIPASLKYLKKWKERFELYGEHPFLQAPTLEKLNNRDIYSLNPFLSYGSNHTLFDHEAQDRFVPRSITIEETVRYLLVKQILCCGGTTDRSGNGTKWGGSVIKETSYDGATAGKLLLTMLAGGTLLDTIHLNMINKEWLSDAKIDFGRPVWESNITKQDDLRGMIATYLYNLLPMSRSILLGNNGKMSMSNGISAAKFPLYRDPMATMHTITKDKGKKTEEVYLPVNPDKAPWRDLQSILQISGGKTGKGSWALRHVMAGTDKDLTIITGGMLYGKAKPIVTCEWQLHIPAGLLQDVNLNFYGAMVDRANISAGAVRYALECYLGIEELSFNDKKKRNVYQSMLSTAMCRYWHALNACANNLITEITVDSDKAQLSWISDVKTYALEAFKQTCGLYEKRDIPEFVKALHTLTRGLDHE